MKSNKEIIIKYLKEKESRLKKQDSKSKPVKD